MKINQLKNIHSWIRNTEISEILFVSALIIPIYLMLYNYAINQINPEWKVWGLTIAVVIYIIGIIWMKRSQSNQEKKRKTLLIIKNYILDKEYKFMSFERINEINKDYT